ncbi:transposase [Streptomyces sp. Act-28]
MFTFPAEHRESLFPPSTFADACPSSSGRPSLPSQVLAATVVQQGLHRLSDFETVREPRCDLWWRATCGLGLHDTAFDLSLPPRFRAGCVVRPIRRGSSTRSKRP